jgi:hypothetical protein
VVTRELKGEMAENAMTVCPVSPDRRDQQVQREILHLQEILYQDQRVTEVSLEVKALKVNQVFQASQAAQEMTD